MLDDFTMIVHKLDRELEGINIYPIGDLHVGSNDMDVELFEAWRKMVLADENGYVVIIGDMMDNGLRNSKTNVYEATMPPHRQKEWLKKEFAPLKDRILGVVRGNHEERSVRETGDCPLYDVCCKLDIEDLYRPNAVFMKVNLGEKRKDRQWSYTLMLAHGGSKNKVKNFGYAVDGLDIMVAGHVHEASSVFPSKIVLDSHNEQVRHVGFVSLVVPSFARMGGYALQKLYTPQDSDKFPVIHLDGTDKGVSVSWIPPKM